MTKKVIIGCIADDFTGAGDVCSFLIEEGATCVLINGVPTTDSDLDVDVIVIALKIRSVPATEAVEAVKNAVSWLEQTGVTRFFYKYCSTFDSTEKGNIGPILDYLLEYCNQKFTIVSPALPENRREVFNGYLFADGLLLNEGSMRTHPLNPMTDSFIPRLLEMQSKHKCYLLNYKTLEMSNDEITDLVRQHYDEYFYLCPDYFMDSQGKKIVDVFGHLNLLSGSSRLISDWYSFLNKSSAERKNKQNNHRQWTKSKTLILSGSLSNQTAKQINTFIDQGGKSMLVDVNRINDDMIEEYVELIRNTDEDLLLYSVRDEFFEQNVREEAAGKLEYLYSELAKRTIEDGLEKLIVAGGETSGAVISGLPYESYEAVDIVAPGVPILCPVNRPEVRIILKSGNFGQDDFFMRGIRLMDGYSE